MTAPKTAEVRDLLNYLAKYEATPPTLVDGEAHNLTLTSDGKLRTDDPTTQAKIDDIEAKLDSATFGLAVLKALIILIPTTPQLAATALTQYNTLVGYVDELETRLTAARAGYLDNINNAQLLNISATILGRIDAAISSRLATASYTAERGTDNAMLAASYVTERGTDNAMLAASYITERGTNNAMLAASYVTERGTDNAMLAANGALEATLTAIKGAGWTTETLHAIYDKIPVVGGVVFTSFTYYANLAAAAIYVPPVHFSGVIMVAGGLDLTNLHMEYYDGAGWINCASTQEGVEQNNTQMVHIINAHASSSYKFRISGVTWA